MPWFQVVQAGTASYAAGGFKITVPEVERIEQASVFMTPQTLLATTLQAGLQLTYQANTATVKVYKLHSLSDPLAWAEVANTTNLSGASFILTGKGI